MKPTAMNCRQAKQNLALWVGDDLEPSAIVALERHISVCPGCREAWVQLRQSQEALATAAKCLPATSLRAESSLPGVEQPAVDSLWPAISRRLPMPASSMQRPRFNGWVPGLAVAVACVAVMIVAVRNVTQSNVPMQAHPSSPFSVMPVGGPASFHEGDSSFPAAIDRSPLHTPRFPRGLPPRERQSFPVDTFWPGSQDFGH